MKIRPYEEKDKNDVRFICLNSEGPNTDGEIINAYVLNTFCDYFIECESENCFVAVDENDRAVAYVICAQDYGTYHRRFIREYLPRQSRRDIRHRFRTRFSAVPQKRFRKEYPAHLHIDVLPEYQRMGVGSSLVDTLCSHLKAKGVAGVMLTTGIDNGRARNFYRKYGFTELKTFRDCVAYGLKLR